MEMDGKYLNKIVDSIIKKADSWITPKNQLDDIHIDELDEVFKSKSVWINSSVEIFNLLKARIENTPYNTVLAIPLRISLKKEDIPASITETILSQTPPSFYLYERANHYEKEFISVSHIVKYPDLKTYHKTYFSETNEIEWREGERLEVYFRNIFII